MNTLTVPPLSDLLPRLFAEADASDAACAAAKSQLSPAERLARVTSATGYRAYYAEAKDFYLAVSRETGKLLYLLARAAQARSIVEFGTSFGISTLHLAAAVRDNGGGQVIGSEFEPAKAAKARENFAAAGLSDLIELREGDALETLATGLPQTVDMILLDGAKALYGPILRLLEPHLRARGLIVADNADLSKDYLAHVRGCGRFVSLPFGKDVELSMKL